MSGIAGIIHFDGRPVELGLIEKMTGAMAHRGPDGIHHWVKGSVALGHCLLNTSDGVINEVQPCSLDGLVWIVADARIDGQQDLRRLLRGAGAHVQSDAKDAELILHAYNVFGDAFLEHIIGDFAFAIWDNRSEKLVCARDHFGMRPFFYTIRENFFLFSSDIDAVLEHPSITASLDDYAIGDFLLFGGYQSPELSIYRDIRRLPPAHVIRMTRAEYCLKEYWVLPFFTEIQYREGSEYIDHFQNLLEHAINDRLRATRVAIELSGGMDSTSIAAVARRSKCELISYTITCGKLLPEDQEGALAQIVASYLAIPIILQDHSDYQLFEKPEAPELQTSEPSTNASLAMYSHRLQQIIQHGYRVLLTGQGGDSLFHGSPGYVASLARHGRIDQLIYMVYDHLRSTGSLVGLGLNSLLRRRTKHKAWQPPFPEWVNADFARKTQMKERWEIGWHRIQDSSGIYNQLRSPGFSGTFENYEALKLPVVVRHPFFDRRLVLFMMGLPNHIKINKRILRQSMSGILPQEILVRQKTGVSGDYQHAKFVQNSIGIPWSKRLDQVEKQYVDTGQYKEIFYRYLNGDRCESTWSSFYIIGPIAFNNWLRQHPKCSFH